MSERGIAPLSSERQPIIADKVSIAKMRDRALQRIAHAAPLLSARLHIDPPALPEFNRDPDYLHAEQLSVLADWIEQAATAPEPEPVTEEGKHGPTKKS